MVQDEGFRGNKCSWFLGQDTVLGGGNMLASVRNLNFKKKEFNSNNTILEVKS